jgi:hypothetical protein
MQKIPAIFKVRSSKNEKNITRGSHAIDKKICALLLSKKNLKRLYTNVVDYDKVDK